MINKITTDRDESVRTWNNDHGMKGVKIGIQQYALIILLINNTSHNN